MKTDRREWAAALAPGLLLALIGLVLAFALAATLNPAERATVGAILAERIALVLLAWVVLAIGLGALARRAYGIGVIGPARLAEQAATWASGSAATTIGADPESMPCTAGARALCESAHRLAAQRDLLELTLDRRVREVSRGIEEERSRLAALMSELSQSVVVCNLDGRILLYNRQARQLSLAPEAGAGPIGLGRSVYAIFERSLVDHAIDRLRLRLRRGEDQPSVQFVSSSRTGQWLRVHLAPVRDASPGATDPDRLTGFVLVMQDITRDFESDIAQERLLHDLTERSRSSLGVLQAAVDVLGLPDLERPERERFVAVVSEEVGAMTARLHVSTARASSELKTRWPLEDMPGADLLHAAALRIESLCEVRVSSEEVDPALWLQVDGYAVLQALVSLASRLVDELAIDWLQLRIGRVDARAHLDLVWTGTALSTETALSWESESMRFGSQTSLLSVRDVVDRHGGEFWFQRDRARQQAFFRFLLPVAAAVQVAMPRTPAAPVDPGPGERPVDTYDFELFQQRVSNDPMDDRRLVDLNYTVFDTETTGLAPSEGDEILQIGAVRIVNNRLLRDERFDTLVDPERGISEASIAIHGITPARVAGQPRIAQVLPAFHAFVGDTVLVAHNAAFDMRFLQLKEEATGIRFDQPVLDTLLLSVAVAPQQEAHSLEAIAARFGLGIEGRHAALGDAMLTAEVFLRLLPMLADKGIHTVGQAHAATRATWHARLKY